MARLIIRPICGEDAARIAGLCDQLGYPSTADQILSRLEVISDDSDQQLSVAETQAGEIIGWVHLHLSRPLISEKRAEIWGLVVDEAWRGQGVGGRLMEFAEEWAESKGCASIWLRSNVIRDRARTFYERLGYRTVKTQRVFRKELKS